LSEPIRAEWASGRRKASLALLLLWLGGASVAVSLIIGLQALAVPRLGADFGRSAFVIPTWGVIALILAILLRRNAANWAVRSIALLWVLIGMAALAWFVQSNA
jgi:hypothetical protein